MQITFNLQKKPGQGEDADPIALDLGDEYWLGAFDGVGGAGAQNYRTGEGTRTGAYIASRLAAATVTDWISKTDSAQRGAADLTRELAAALSGEAAALPGSSVAIRSKMIRPLPTTAALLRVRPAAPQEPYHCQAIWAGDSRVYVLTPRHGLMQISRDHLKEDLDALENLTADSPLSNYISADGVFELEADAFTLRGPFLAITASDGCFGYVESPVVFEYLLLSSLLQANDLEDWKAQLTTAIGAVAADDASAAIALFGWASLREAKTALRTRLKVVSGMVAAMDAAHQAVENAKVALGKAEQAVAERRLAVWADYRRDYEGYRPRERS